MQGVNTQVSAPNRSTAWTTALIKNPDTCGATTSLMRMGNILIQTFLAWDKFFTTADQSISAVYITPPGI